MDNDKPICGACEHFDIEKWICTLKIPYYPAGLRIFWPLDTPPCMDFEEPYFKLWEEK